MSSTPMFYKVKSMVNFILVIPKISSYDLTSMKKARLNPPEGGHKATFKGASLSAVGIAEPS